MKKMLLRLAWVTWMMIPFSLFAQVPDTLTSDLRNQLERLTEDTETEYDFSEFAEELEELIHSPVNLNSRNPEELRRLFFLNDKQI